MKVDMLIDLLRSHLAALESPVWPAPHDASNGPVFFLDAGDTRELIAALTKLREENPGPRADGSRPRPPGSASAA
jgi:hypothetical protein